jgi:hypothetical protein
MDGVPLGVGLRVHHPQRGLGTVIRVAEPDVVVRWENEIAEPGRTTFVAAAAVSALPEARAA